MILYVENWVVVDNFVEMALDGLRLVEEECGVWSPRACRGEPVFTRISWPCLADTKPLEEN